MLCYSLINYQTFGDKACHPERSEGSGSPAEILRFAQDDKRGERRDDSRDISQVRSQKVLSPNISSVTIIITISTRRRNVIIGWITTIISTATCWCSVGVATIDSGHGTVDKPIGDGRLTW